MFSGSIVALITPFTNNTVDEDALRKLVAWHIEQGTDGIVPVGTTGESPVLSEEEHCRVVEIVVEACEGKIPVIAGAGSNNTVEAVKYSKHAETAGATATLHVAGYYNRPSQAGLYQHFKTVHDASALPMIIYNIPPRAVVDVEPETMAALAELPRVVGVKDATGDLNRPNKERLLINSDDFAYLSGEDGTSVAYNVSGGKGCISVTANVAPKLCAEVQAACLEGDFVKAKKIQDRLMPLHFALFGEPNPAGVKYAVSLLGFCDDFCRLPNVPLSEKTKNNIREAMTTIGLI